MYTIESAQKPPSYPFSWPSDLAFGESHVDGFLPIGYSSHESKTDLEHDIRAGKRLYFPQMDLKSV